MRRLRQQSNLRNTRATPGLLDYYPGAAFGYSFRRLRNSYTGACIRIRRDTDNAETDIGFINESGTYWIDENAIITFTPDAAKAYIVKIYDQSLFANDAIQTTAANQLLICNSGAIVRNGIRPTFLFTGVENYNILEISGTLKWTSFKIVQAGDLNAEDTPTIANNSAFNLYDLHQNKGDKYLYGWGNEGYTRAYPLSALPLPRSILNYVYSYNTSLTYKNNTFYSLAGFAPLTNTAKFLTLGRIGATNFCTGDFQEYVFYSSDKTTSRSAIVSNMNAAYNVF